MSAVQSETVHVHWVCGCFTEPPTWGGEDAHECDAEWESEESREEWDARICRSVCPECRQVASQRMDQATLIT